MPVRKPPKTAYRNTVTLLVCTGVDSYSAPIYGQTYTITGVNMQASNETIKTKDNTEVVLRSVLFIDSQYSSPVLDIEALKDASEAAGGDLRVEHGGRSYAVKSVDVIDDDLCRFDHCEAGLV